MDAETLRCLYRERAGLVGRKYDGGLDDAQARRLAEIDAALDAHEMAVMAPDFARMEALAAKAESLAGEVSSAVEWARTVRR